MYMHIAWYVAATALGLALGLHFGRLLTAVVAHWESTKIASKVSMAVITFLLGGGGGAAIFEYISAAKSGPFYGGGLAVGMIASFFSPRLPGRYTLESVLHVVKMSDALRDAVPDVKERALLILTPLAPPGQIQREAKLNEAQLAHALERAIDLVPDEQLENEGDDGP